MIALASHWDRTDDMMNQNISECVFFPEVPSSYNSLGQRVGITEYTSGSTEPSSQRYFIWSGARPVQELDAQGHLVREFFGNGITEADGTKYFYTKDHLGSVCSVVRDDGSIAARYAYSPYGMREQTEGSYHADFGYTGHFHHERSGLVLTWFRAYEPELGMWLSKEPLGEMANLNLYAYGFRNPINGFDPDGLDWLDDTSNFFAGWADTITFGLTDAVREGIGINETVDRCSKAYNTGGYTGTAVQVAASGGAAGAALVSRHGVSTAAKNVSKLTQVTTPHAKNLAKEFNSGSKAVLKNIPKDVLRAYREIAKNALKNGRDAAKSQKGRLDMINDVLTGALSAAAWAAASELYKEFNGDGCE